MTKSDLSSGAPAAAPRSADERGGSVTAPIEHRQFWLITVGAVAIFFALRFLPTGTNLSHMDFRVDPKAGNAIEFCDPLNPQFIPVVAAKSPVTMSIAVVEPPTVGRDVRAVVTLKTGSGKPVAPEDLVVTHTRKLHLLIVDPTLTDYQHVHPTPMRTAGEWAFSFTPRREGTYRVFGDFTPAATARGLYASVDLAVASSAVRKEEMKAAVVPGKTGEGSRTFEAHGIVFSLATTPTVTRAGQPIDLRFAMQRRDGGSVPLEPVMGAFAHLVAFDAARSGFAHLHPAETDLAKTPDAKSPSLNFKLTIPRAGHYVIWAQVSLGGEERFVPFDLEVSQ